MSDATEHPAPRRGRPAHWRPFVPRVFARSYTPRNRGIREQSLFSRGTEWLLPWELRDYPGKWRGVAEVVGLSLETVRVYIKRRAVLSVPVAVALHRAISVRVEAAQVLLAELEAVIAAGGERKRRKREAGFMAVDPTTGLSGRVKAGHRRGVKPG